MYDEVTAKLIRENETAQNVVNECFKKIAELQAKLEEIEKLADFWKSISDGMDNTFAWVTSNHADSIIEILKGEQNADAR